MNGNELITSLINLGRVMRSADVLVRPDETSLEFGYSRVVGARLEDGRLVLVTERI